MAPERIELIAGFWKNQRNRKLDMPRIPPGIFTSTVRWENTIISRVAVGPVRSAGLGFLLYLIPSSLHSLQTHQ